MKTKVEKLLEDQAVSPPEDDATILSSIAANVSRVVIERFTAEGIMGAAAKV